MSNFLDLCVDWALTLWHGPSMRPLVSLSHLKVAKPMPSISWRKNHRHDDRPEHSTIERVKNPGESQRDGYKQQQKTLMFNPAHRWLVFSRSNCVVGPIKEQARPAHFPRPTVMARQWTLRVKVGKPESANSISTLISRSAMDWDAPRTNTGGILKPHSSVRVAISASQLLS